MAGSARRNMRSDSKPESVFIIGIAGGSCSGKSTFAKLLREALGINYCGVLSQDSYYFDQSHHFDTDGGAVNFDHPDSIDFKLMREHLLQLQRGEIIEIPIYDFTYHQRLVVTEKVYPADVILLEGTLILTQPPIVELLSESVFLETPEAIRLQRRLLRDSQERGRTREGILMQFQNHVKPMHDQLCAV